MQELSTPSGASATSTRSTVKHLVVMANGLFGNASNWNVVIENLQKVLDTRETLLVASDANSLRQTFDGIDSCGDRLATEIKSVVQQHPSLHKISFIGHSMGGLLVRYAAGKLYDPSSKLICGLMPAHFITLATPHMGCDGEGPAQVPFIGWTRDLPLAGNALQKLLQVAAKPFVAAFMGRSGQQFFLHDTEEGQVPLLVRMTENVQGQGYFLAALDSFATRTCYGNAGGDHLVGWANSSIRRPDQLPQIDPAMQLTGVIREDPLAAAVHAHDRTLLGKASSNVGHETQWTVGLDGCKAGNGVEGSWTQKPREPDNAIGMKPSGQQVAMQDAARSQQHAQAGSTQSQQTAEHFVDSSRNALLMLERLQSMPWRRIDVSFQGTAMPFFAHNHIQVTRKWLNWYGNTVCQHLAQQLAGMEKSQDIQQIILSRVQRQA